MRCFTHFIRIISCVAVLMVLAADAFAQSRRLGTSIRPPFTKSAVTPALRKERALRRERYRRKREQTAARIRAAMRRQREATRDRMRRLRTERRERRARIRKEQVRRATEQSRKSGSKAQSRYDRVAHSISRRSERRKARLSKLGHKHFGQRERSQSKEKRAKRTLSMAELLERRAAGKTARSSRSSSISKLSHGSKLRGFDTLSKRNELRRRSAERKTTKFTSLHSSISAAKAFSSGTRRKRKGSSAELAAQRLAAPMLRIVKDLRGATEPFKLKEVNVLIGTKYKKFPLIDLRKTVAVSQGRRKKRFDKDGKVYNNSEGFLPKKKMNYYSEWTHPTRGLKFRGSQRIIKGGKGEIYYSPDHYTTFWRLR